MKKTKKIIVIILILILLILAGVGAFFVIRNNTSSEEASSSKSSKIQTGTFEYMLNAENHSTQDTYYYSDDYFKSSGKELNPHLRTMSMCFALTSINAIDKENESENAENLLNEIGFSDIQVDDINEETSRNTIGSAIAHKKIGGKELIAVTIRGGQYRKEWISNMTAGKSGDIVGFADAAKTMVSRIKEYKEKYNIKDCKLWITGYSRGGAVSNLVGRNINENLSEFNTTENDLYIYTFEAPLASADDAVYENIHNVINKNDLIVYLFPKKWGLYNNGVEEIIDVSDEKSYSEFLDEFIDWLTKSSKVLDYSISRDKYVNYLEEPICNIVEISTSKTRLEKMEILLFFKEVFESITKDESIKEIEDALPNISSGNFNFDVDRILSVIKNDVEEVYKNSDVPLTREELDMIESSVKPVAEVLAPIIVSSIFDGSEKININGFEIPGFYHLYTFATILPEVIKDHYFEKNLELLKKMDSYYLNEK